MNRIRTHVWFRGKVQGVFFRAFTREQAEQLGVNGWVRNLPDGRVEAVFEGTEDAVRELLRRCRVGPPLARVEGVEIVEEAPQGEKTFRIR